jgi:hypothetical protein
MALLRRNNYNSFWEDEPGTAGGQLDPPDPDDGPVHGGPYVPPVVEPVPVGGGGGGGGGFSGLTAYRPQFDLPGLPVFKPPKFDAPTLADAMNEPGYQFRAQAGQDALERSAAARGVLRTGGTLKDLTEYGQNFASSEYSNVFNRALGVYDREYRGAYDSFAPKMEQYRMMSQAEMQAEMARYQREYQLYALANQGGGGGGGPIEPFNDFDPNEWDGQP